MVLEIYGKYSSDLNLFGVSLVGCSLKQTHLIPWDELTVLYKLSFNRWSLL